MGTAVITRLRTWFDDARQATRARLFGRSTASRILSHDTHPFDRHYHVDTAGLFYADQLITGHPRDAHSAGYYATAPSLIQGALRCWAATLSGTPYSLADYALVDVGCGKGRVLLLASQYPFRQITGIELHPGLADIARCNLRSWSRRTPMLRPGRRSPFTAEPVSLRYSPLANFFSLRRPHSRRAVPLRAPRPFVQVIQGDALAIPFPPGPLVVFFFNSFERDIVDLFLDKLLAEAASRTDPLDLIYIHPEFGALVRRRPGIRLLVDVELPYSQEDAQADAFGTDFDRVAIFRLDPAPPPPLRAA